MRLFVLLVVAAFLFSPGQVNAQASDTVEVAPSAPAEEPEVAAEQSPPVPATEGADVGTEPADVVPQTDVAALPPASQAVTPPSPEREIAEQVSMLKPDIDVNLIPPLFFSRWEHDLIQDARRGLVTRPPESEDDFAAVPVVPEETGPMPRNVSLAGIVYRSNKDWVIWLNNRRILPNAIPTEILDLQVYKDHIKLEWFDKDTNQVFPIKLRPHQTFNLDTRIFLPG